jgi:hypothetical protein
LRIASAPKLLDRRSACGAAVLAALAPAAPAFAAALPAGVGGEPVRGPGSSLAVANLEPRAQWRAAVSEVDSLVADLEKDAVTGGGDGIRRRLGTVGTTSPLFQIDKACRSLLPDADDPVAFGEALEEFLLGLGRADSMAYSANFAGGSGNPRENSPAALLAKAKREVTSLKRSVDEMDRALGGR